MNKTILSTRRTMGLFNVFGSSLKLLDLKENESLMFYLDNENHKGEIRKELSDSDNYKPNKRGGGSCKAFKSVSLYRRFRKCFNLTGDSHRFLITEFNGVFTFELIKKKKDLKYY